MHVQAPSRDKPLFLYGLRVLCRCAVIEYLWRLTLLKLHVDVHGVSLVGSYFRFILVKGVSSLLVGADDIFKQLASEGAATVNARNQLLNARPAVLVKTDAIGARIVPQNIADKPACLDM